jgi:glycosyltransferase involved in cell wall biosynthesis
MDRILPRIWKEKPDTELWIVGSNPPPEIVALAGDSRVHITGFVKEVTELLSSMSAALCPWKGTYGFRSRLIELMALGVPVVASSDAMWGMGMDCGKGVFLEETDEKMAQTCLKLIRNPEFADQQSRKARAQVERKFSFEATYGKLARDLVKFAARSARDR